MVTAPLRTPAASPYPRIYARQVCPTCDGERLMGDDYGRISDCWSCAGLGVLTIHVGPVPGESMLMAYVVETGLLGPVETDADARELAWFWDAHKASSWNLDDRVALQALGVEV